MTAMFDAQSEALEKDDQPKWEQKATQKNPNPRPELTEDQKLESLLDPGAAAFQQDVAGGSLTGGQKLKAQALPQQVAGSASSGLLID
jgi:hypothetical protein